MGGSELGLLNFASIWEQFLLFFSLNWLVDIFLVVDISLLMLCLAFDKNCFVRKQFLLCIKIWNL